MVSDAVSNMGVVLCRACSGQYCLDSLQSQQTLAAGEHVVGEHVAIRGNISFIIVN